jgi:pimeloyl-ACP methyl ester carboxylesterase
MKEVPLVLIHGYPFSHSMWFSTIAALGTAARVIAPDLPGFGRNPVRTDGQPSLETMADYLVEVLDENEQARAVIAGMSMGGYVALAFAEKYPQRTRALGLISSQASADSAETRSARFEMIQKIRNQGPSVAAQGILPKLFSGPEPRHASLKEYPIEGANTAGAEGLSYALEAMARRPDRSALLRSLRSPILIVHGADDKIVPGAKARELAENCRNPILVELPGVGHASPLEAPDQVAAALARLMRKCREEDHAAAGSA